VAVFPDTSALAKLYHHEIGTELVERIVDGSPGQCFISRLGVLEMQWCSPLRSAPAPFQPMNPGWLDANFEGI
jgi:hypothetical protein